MPDYRDVYAQLSDEKIEDRLDESKIEQRKLDLEKRKERQDLLVKNKFLVGDNLWEFFYERGVKVDIFKDVILADSYSKDGWLKLAEKVQEGGASPEELVDAISMSHFNVCDEGDTDRATEVIEDIVHRNLKGRLGQKLITSVIKELDKQKLLAADPGTVKNLIEYKDSKEDQEVKPESSENLPVESKTIRNNIYNDWNKELEDLNYDQLRYVKFDDLITRLQDDTDFQFDILHHVIFDCGYENISKKMVTGEESFVIYTICLNKVFTDTDGKPVEDETTFFERSVTKFIIEDIKDKSEQEINKLLELVKLKYTALIDYRFNNLKKSLKIT